MKKNKIATIIPLLSSVLIAVLIVVGSTYASDQKAEEKDTSNQTSTSSYTIPSDMVVIGEEAVALTDCDANRLNNIKVAAQSIDGTKLASGEIFSFNQIVGDTTQNTKYKESGTIVDDEIVSMRGGGICLLSSLMYKAALVSGLEVVERHPHTMLQDYIALGFDATVAYGSMDFQFKNSTSSDLIIQVKVSDSEVRVLLYGKDDNPDTTYDVTSQIAEVYSTTNDTSQQIYYVVDSYLITYQNGQQLSKELLSTDTYLAETNSLPLVSENNQRKSNS